MLSDCCCRALLCRCGQARYIAAHRPALRERFERDVIPVYEVVQMSNGSVSHKEWLP